MIDMLERHAIRVLRRAGHSLPEAAKLAGASVRSAQWVGAEAAVSHIDNDTECARRKIGRPSKAEPSRGFVVTQLAKEPGLFLLEVLRRARPAGHPGRPQTSPQHHDRPVREAAAFRTRPWSLRYRVRTTNTVRAVVTRSAAGARDSGRMTDPAWTGAGA